LTKKQYANIKKNLQKIMSIAGLTGIDLRFLLSRFSCS